MSAASVTGPAAVAGPGSSLGPSAVVESVWRLAVLGEPVAGGRLR